MAKNLVDDVTLEFVESEDKTGTFIPSEGLSGSATVRQYGKVVYIGLTLMGTITSGAISTIGTVSGVDIPSLVSFPILGLGTDAVVTVANLNTDGTITLALPDDTTISGLNANISYIA